MVSGTIVDAPSSMVPEPRGAPVALRAEPGAPGTRGRFRNGGASRHRGRAGDLRPVRCRAGHLGAQGCSYVGPAGRPVRDVVAKYTRRMRVRSYQVGRPHVRRRGPRSAGRPDTVVLGDALSAAGATIAPPEVLADRAFVGLALSR